MNTVKLKVKNAFVAFEGKLLSARDQLSTILLSLKNRAYASTDASQPVDASIPEDGAPDKLSCWDLYTSKYNGTTCIYQQALKRCDNCHSSCFSLLEFTKTIFGCVINLLCYPFIPCAIALLPASFQFAGYSNVNSLYPCYGKTCCFCITNQEKGCFRFVCSPVSCLLFISLLLAASFLLLWNETQSSLLMIDILLFFENLNQPTSVLLFVISFTIVSFPIMWGYVFFNLAAGYLYGFWMGLVVVIFSVTIGLTTAHLVCKKYFSTCVMNLLKRRSNFDQIEAILQVIDGSSGLKVITLTRLTPIPFGFQNGLFAVSNVSLKYYLLASDVGLLPTQILNCYIASKFRSMDQIVGRENPKGYLLFFMQVAIGLALMMFVVQRARKELANALQNTNKTSVSSLNKSEEVSTNEAELESVKCSQPISTTTPFRNENKTPLVDV